MSVPFVKIDNSADLVIDYLLSNKDAFLASNTSVSTEYVLSPVFNSDGFLGIFLLLSGNTKAEIYTNS